MIEIPPHIRGLVFDCDGTIADTMPLHYRAWEQAVGEHGAELPEALFYEMAGVPTAEIVRALNERHGFSLPIQPIVDRKEALFLAMIPEVVPIEPVVTLVRENAGRLPMAVATGGTRSICMKTLKALGLDGFFQAVATADEVPRGKPAPDVFLEAARRLGVEPTACMAFEDAELGLESARAAGMVVVDIRPLRR